MANQDTPEQTASFNNLLSACQVLAKTSRSCLDHAGVDHVEMNIKYFDLLKAIKNVVLETEIYTEAKQ